MNYQKLHWLVDWFVIIIFLIFVFCTTTVPALWKNFTYIAPLFIFFALGMLLLNNISIKNCFQTKEKEFFLMAGGILLSGINLILVHSRIGAFFTIADFLLLLYLADKVRFNKIQVSVIAAVCFSIWFYWHFINKENYLNTTFNPNTVSVFLFAHFCVFICSFVYFLSLCFQLPKWGYYFVILVLIIVLTRRVFSFNCRGVLLGILAWIITYYFLPKKPYTILLVIGASLLMPVIYVLLWKSNLVEGVVVYGKQFASGRDIIWYEFFNAFIRHPITGIGSDFDRMVPDLYLKEVHHALLDLLFVHGIPVFLIVLYLMYRRIEHVIVSCSDPVRAVCLASIYGMLTSGSFEIFYVLSPYNAMFLTIFIIANTYTQEQETLLQSSNKS